MESVSDDSVKYVYNLLTGRLDPVNNAESLAAGAAQLFSLFKVLVDGGFSEDQAIRLLAEFLIGMCAK